MSEIRVLTGEADLAATVASETPVLVDFWAPWCGPCRMVAPALKELARELDGKVRIAKINVDDHPDAALRWGVRGIPTMVLFRQGREIDRFVGAASKPTLELWLSSRAA